MDLKKLNKEIKNVKHRYLKEKRKHNKYLLYSYI